MLRVAKTEYGMVQGTPGADARNTIFKGIPFAASAIGERMWKPPVAPEPWEGIRVCNEFAPITMQKVPGENPEAFYAKEWHVDPEVPMSEDGSLALNIYTPAKSADEKMINLTQAAEVLVDRYDHREKEMREELEQLKIENAKLRKAWEELWNRQ